MCMAILLAYMPVHNVHLALMEARREHQNLHVGAVN